MSVSYRVRNGSSAGNDSSPVLVIASFIRIIHVGMLIIRSVVPTIPLVLLYGVRRDRKAMLRSIGVALANAAEAIGPATVKMAQAMSYRRDLISPDLVQPLARLQEHVRAPSMNSLRKAVADAYGPALWSVFESIDFSPIACGSVAVILRARIRGGGNVVLKVVRPSVARSIANDVRIMSAIVRTTIASRKRFEGVPVVAVFDRFAELVVQQCDMEMERQNCERLGRMLSFEFAIPKIHSAQSRPNVLVSDYLPRAKKFDREDLSAEVYEQNCRILLHSVYSMIFVHGFVHGDLHPGNIGVDEYGRIVLYDFGLVAKISAEDRINFRDFFLALALGDSVIVAEKIIQSADHSPTVLDRESFQSAVDQLVRRFSGQTAGEFLVTGFVEALFDLQRRFRLYGTPGFANAVWALAMYEGLVRHDYPTLDFQAEARPFILQSFLGSGEGQISR